MQALTSMDCCQIIKRSSTDESKESKYHRLNQDKVIGRGLAVHNFSQLKILCLSGQGLVGVPIDSIPLSVQVLDLSHNKIETVEGHLLQLSRLRVLDLSHNQISDVAGRGLAKCGSLRELHLRGNRVKQLNGFYRLKKLRVLDLSYNDLPDGYYWQGSEDDVAQLHWPWVGQLAANKATLEWLSVVANPAVSSLEKRNQLIRLVACLLPTLKTFATH